MYIVIDYFCTRIRERTAHQHDERGNLGKGDEVRGSKQNSNRHSDSKKNFSIFLLKNLAVKKSPYLCSRNRKESESSLKDLHINK